MVYRQRRMVNIKSEDSTWGWLTWGKASDEIIVIILT